MKITLENQTKFLRDVSIIIGIVIGGWFTLEAIFVTQEKMARHDVKEITQDIRSSEVVRDYYQVMLDDGEELDKYEARSFRINNASLDKMYIKLDNANEVLQEYER